MKKILVITVVATMLFALCACSNSANLDNSDNSTTAPTTEATTINGEQSTKTTEKKENEATSSSNPLDNIIIENPDEVTNADGSVNEEIIGTTKHQSSGNSPYATTKQQSFETDIIPIE